MTEQLNNENNRQKTPGFLALRATKHPTPSPTANSTGSTLKTPPESDISHPTLSSKPPAPPQAESGGLFSLLSLPPPAPCPKSSLTDDGRTRSNSQPSSAPPPPLSSVRHRLPTELRRKPHPCPLATSSSSPWAGLAILASLLALTCSRAFAIATPLPGTALTIYPCSYFSPGSSFQVQLLCETSLTSRHTYLALPTAFLSSLPPPHTYQHRKCVTCFMFLSCTHFIASPLP